MKPDDNTLRALPYLSEVGPRVLAQLADIALLVRIGPDEVLFRDGEVPDHVSFILGGAIASTITRAEAGEAIAEVLEPPRIVGLSALLDAPALAGARTVTSARLVALPAPALRSMLAEVPSLAEALVLSAVSEVQALTLAVCQLRLLTAPQRLAAYLLELVTDPTMTPARLVLPIRKHLLAARIGCTPENLSRTIATLRPLGVETRGAGVVIRDLSRLRVYASLAGVDEPAASPTTLPTKGSAALDAEVEQRVRLGLV